MHGLAYRLFRIWFKIVETLLPGFAGKWAVKLFFSPPKFKTPHREKQYLENATKREIPFRISPQKLYNVRVVNEMLNDSDFNSDKEKDHYTLYESGSGEATILLVHGWAGRASQMGAIAASFAEQGYRTVAFDAFAHAGNPGKQTTVIEFAEIVKHVHGIYGPFKAVIGHSLGGIALGNAILQGIKTERLITIGSPTTFKYILEEFCKIINGNDNTLEYIRKFTLKYANVSLEDFSLENIGEKLTLPGLIIHDVNDNEAPYEQALLFDKTWKNGQLITTKKLGHTRILRDSETIALMIDFVKNGSVLNRKTAQKYIQSEMV
jgi:pimeloyl-ACP methyl ester carboxylesterase